jgi:hypothetical protein
MIPAMEVFTDLVRYESMENVEFKVVGSTNKAMTVKAYVIIRKKLLVNWNEGGYGWRYNRVDGSTEYVRNGYVEEVVVRNGKTKMELVLSGSKSCTCYHFSDKAMCSHLVAACILDKVFVPGLKTKVIE